MARRSNESAELNFQKMRDLKVWVNEQMDMQREQMYDLDSTLKQLASIHDILESMELIMLGGGKSTDAVIVELMHDIKLIMHVSIKKFEATHADSTPTSILQNNNWQKRYYSNTLEALRCLGLSSTQPSSSSYDDWSNELNFDNNWLFYQLSPSSAANPNLHAPDRFIAINLASAITKNVLDKSPLHVFKSDAGFAACAFSRTFIYLFGGVKSDGSQDFTIRECNCLQFSQTAPLESPEIPEWVRLSSPLQVPLRRPHTLVVGKNIFLFGVENLSSEMCRPATFAFTYDLETREWSSIADPVSSDWFMLDLFSWARWEDEEKVETLIVVLKELTEKPYCMREKLCLRLYNARENRWEFFSYIDCSEYGGLQQFLAVNDYLFHIRGAKWHVFSLMHKKSNGFVQGLESLLELPGVYLLPDGSSNGFTGVANLNLDSQLPASCLKFCVAWIGSMACLNFAVVGIKNRENQFFGHIFSFGSVQVEGSFHFGQCIGFCPCFMGEDKPKVTPKVRIADRRRKKRFFRLKSELEMERVEEDGSRQINFGGGSFV